MVSTPWGLRIFNPQAECSLVQPKLWLGRARLQYMKTFILWEKVSTPFLNGVDSMRLTHFQPLGRMITRLTQLVAGSSKTPIHKNKINVKLLFDPISYGVVSNSFGSSNNAFFLRWNWTKGLRLLGCVWRLHFHFRLLI